MSTQGVEVDELATSDVGLDDPRPINVAVRTNDMAIASMMALEAYVVGLKADVAMDTVAKRGKHTAAEENRHTHTARQTILHSQQLEQCICTQLHIKLQQVGYATA